MLTQWTQRTFNAIVVHISIDDRNLSDDEDGDDDGSDGASTVVRVTGFSKIHLQTR